MRNKLLITLVILLWGGALLTSLWWYKSRFVRPFSDSTSLFVGAELEWPSLLTQPGNIRLVHFWEPACPCNGGNQQHLAELMQGYANTVDFYHVQKPGSKGHLPPILASLQPLPLSLPEQPIPASPAVAIFDPSGQLAYFGPYSEGAVCTSSNSFIEPVLDALAAGRSVAAGNGLASGCFCDW